jgi:hypothetical protein
MNDRIISDCKWCRWKCPDRNFVKNLDICLEGLSKVTNNLSVFVVILAEI